MILSFLPAKQMNRQHEFQIKLTSLVLYCSTFSLAPTEIHVDCELVLQVRNFKSCSNAFLSIIDDVLKKPSSIN